MNNAVKPSPDDLRAQLEQARAERARIDQRIAALEAQLSRHSAPQPHLGVPLPPSPQGTSLSFPAPVPDTTTPGLPLIGASSVDLSGLSRMEPEQLDVLPYGVITLDARGRVLHYSDTESRMVGLPRDAVVGRNFFQDIAPCTRVQEFEGRFRDYVHGRSRAALESFEFVFRFSSGAQRVVILLTPARYRGQFQVAILRQS